MQREQVLRLAGAIENEMHAIGLGPTSGPFESWLLETYLPSLHEPGPLPDPVNLHDQGLRAWALPGPEDDGPKRLLDLLFRLDHALLIGIEVTRFGFFETGVAAEKGKLESSAGRAFVSRFAKASTRYVTWQVELAHPEKCKRPVPIAIEWRVTLQDGSHFARGLMELLIQPTWSTSWLAKGWGWEQPGNWALGTHTCSLQLWRQPLAEAKFEIF